MLVSSSSCARGVVHPGQVATYLLNHPTDLNKTEYEHILTFSFALLHVTKKYRNISHGFPSALYVFINNHNDNKSCKYSLNRFSDMSGLQKPMTAFLNTQELIYCDTLDNQQVMLNCCCSYR